MLRSEETDIWKSGRDYNASSEWGVKRKLRKLHKESEAENNPTKPIR